MTHEEEALLYYQYALDLEADGYGGIAFTPTEFFQNLEEDLEVEDALLNEALLNEAFKWNLDG